MPTRRQFIRDCSVAATVASLTPTALLAQGGAGRREVSDQLAFEQFASQLNTSFSIPAAPRAFRLLLVEANRLPAATANSEDARNERFRLLFRGAAQQALGQDTYAFEHPRLGRLTMFIVPMGYAAGASHCYYEAVFNYPVHPADVVAQLALAPQPAGRG
jgi:hypothetical protein